FQNAEDSPARLGESSTERNLSMSKEAAHHHAQAAEHHEHAASHHREAAKHHEAGDHEKAAHHAHLAHGHDTHASHHADEAAKAHAEAHGTKQALTSSQLAWTAAFLAAVALLRRVVDEGIAGL